MIARNLLGKKIIGDNLQLASIAKKRKLENPNSINATVGTLANEDGKFYTFKTIDYIIKNFQDESIYDYSPTDGGNLYKDAVLSWVFKDYKEQILKNFYYHVIASTGGTGAVSNAVTSSLNPNETLILPHLYWGPYANMADALNVKVKTYQMFKGDSFNFEGFKECVDEVAQKESKVTLIINDPCHNPTGYTLSDDELLSIINLINSKPNISFSFIYDIAYFDYPVTRKDVRQKFTLLTKLNENAIIHIAFSCSKSFSIYGLRTGAQIILGKDKDAVSEFYDSALYLSRTRWSNIPRAGINMLIKIVNDEKLQKEFLEEQRQATIALQNRATIFANEATLDGLLTYPYHGGFFVTICCQDGEKLADELQKEDIFVIPLKEAIRVSISSLSIKEITGLAKRIKNTLDSLEKNN